MPLGATAMELAWIPGPVLVQSLMGLTFHMCIVMVAGKISLAGRASNRLIYY